METKSTLLSNFCDGCISQELQSEYEESLKKIDAIFNNKQVMDSISARLPNDGELDDDRTYADNIRNTIQALNKQYTIDNTWSL